jgi:hypothetical protein
VTRSTTSRFLHVANGTSTTRTIEAAGIPGARSIWADPLYEGPVPAGVSDDELMEIRGRYLAPHGHVDPAHDFRRWRDVIAAHDSYDELVLWFEHDLFDQLNLIQLLAWMRERLPSDKAVSLVCIGSFPGRPRFKGLGELTPGELAPLLHKRERVVEAQYSLAERAWMAFREPTPEPLDEFRSADLSPLPYLGAAITRFLEEFPWTTDGLSRTERRLMELAAEGPIDLIAAFPRMHDDEASYYVTDASLRACAVTLSSASPPLLTCSPEAAADRRTLSGSVTLAEAGHAVMAGRTDRITLCGIDRWLGGVHLQGHGKMWRWDERRDAIVRA